MYIQTYKSALLVKTNNISPFNVESQNWVTAIGPMNNRRLNRPTPFTAAKARFD